MPGVVPVEAQLVEFVRRSYADADEIVVEGLAPIPGGFSRETFMFDAVIRHGEVERRVAFILRKDPPAAAALLASDRHAEHLLIESLRSTGRIPVTRSHGAEMDASVFGEPAMLLERASGSSKTSDLFNDGPDATQCDEVIRHLCEVLVELHTADIAAIDPHGMLADPRGVGIDASSWDSYMDTTFEYYIRSYPDIAFDPAMAIYLDSFLTLRRRKPRPLRLSVVHGDFNPANFLYENGRVTALIDWENSRIGDPREDLGWMTTMDLLSNTSVMAHPRDEGGFLAYYNKLTGWDVTQAEVEYFSLFGTANIAVPVASAIKRRVDGEHHQFMHLYVIQSSSANLVGFARMLAYPGVA